MLETEISRSVLRHRMLSPREFQTGLVTTAARLLNRGYPTQHVHDA